MKNLNTLFIGLLITIITASPAITADDTDIYINASTVETDRTNVLIGMDTSGSMASHVVNPENDYNPNRNYATERALPIEYDRLNGNWVDYQRTNFNCRSDRIYVIPWTVQALMPYQHLASLTSHINDEIRTIDGDRNYLQCDTEFRQWRGHPERVVELEDNEVFCPAAREAIEKTGYFFDTDGVCDGFDIPSNTGGSGYLKANYLDNMLVDGNFLAYAYRCAELKDNSACASEFEGVVLNRMELTKDVVHDILKNDAGYDINVGIMRFNSNLTHTSRNIEDYGDNTVASFNPSGGTPLETTYYHMYQYFNDSLSASTPITNACQKNMIIYLTDGTPNGDSSRNDEIRALTGSTCSGEGECMPALAEYMYNNDLSNLPNYPDAGGTPRLQTVETHTIGFFDTDRGNYAKPIRLMRDSARLGGGTFAQVSDTSSVRSAFASALENIIQDASTFTSPSLSVNNFNRLTNLDDLYFSLFQPASEPLWSGNIKKYELEDGVIVDARAASAIDATGQFDDNALSFWTQGADDGNDVIKGGFASRLTVNRKILSNLVTLDPADTTETAANLSVTGNIINGNNANLTNSLFGGAVDDATADQYINWLRGLTTDINGNTVSTNKIGDTLHTTPTVLTYNTAGITVTNPDDLDRALFFGTNSGFIHGIDVNPAATGSMEHFAFFPKELLPRVPEFYDNEIQSPFSKVYGIDGPISSWIEDDNGNSIIESGETAHLYATMRRGGSNVYALDVTDKDDPDLEWVITPSSPGFEELGQTWSRVIPAVIPYGNGTTFDTSTKEVLIFAGGYDTNQDKQDTNGDGKVDASDSDLRRTDTKGRAIYIVDPATGDLIWRAVPSATSNVGETLTLTDMQYSIPSDISVLDVNADGISDRMYVGDMGGQVWRFDMRAPDSAGTANLNITGGVIANLADNSQTNSRRFFYEPSVSRIADDTFGSFLSISMGSGKRADPKYSDVNDKFYMFKDPYVNAPKLDNNGDATYNYLTSSVVTDDGSNIVDITNNPNPLYNEIGPFGWSIDFPDSGEKVLSAALTADGTIFFTTYVPSSATNTLSCDLSASVGGGRLYAVSLLTGRAAYEVDPTTGDLVDADPTNSNSSAATHAGRYTSVDTPGIPPSPQMIITEGNNNIADCSSATSATLLVGSQAERPPICTAPVRTYWHRYDK